MKEKSKRIIRKTLKWILGIMATIVVLAIIALLYFKSTAFQLEPWEYADEQATTTLPERPNILLLVAEDMSARVGSFGDPVAETPNIDGLASKGVRFPNVFTTAGVCSPSRAALILGMNQISTGGQHMRTANRPAGEYKSVPPDQVKAFPELLRAAGYYTFNLKKEDYQFSGAFTGSGPFTIWDDEDNPDLWRGRKDKQPFFGMVNFFETHESGLFTPLGNKPNSAIHLGMQLMRSAMVMSTEGKEVDPDKIQLPPYYPDTPVIRNDMARYYKNIHSMDHVVGDILERLQKDGLAESTIVIWTTDHGDCLPRGKRDLYDSGLKVPMVIYWPEAYRPKDMHPGTWDNRMVSFIDFAPTLLEMAKAPKAPYLQGIDFINDTIPNTYVYAAKDRIDEIAHRQRAVRDDHFKYIRNWMPDQPDGHHLAFRDNLEMMKELWRLKAEGKLNKDQLKWFGPTGEEQLYDIVNDPHELHNLVNDTAHARTLDRMRKALDGWLEKIGDWSEVPEDDMVSRFQPNGEQEVTPVPEITIDNGTVVLTCENRGASIGYRIDDGNWQLYSSPFKTPGQGTISAKAVRYGWKESEEVRVDL